MAMSVYAREGGGGSGRVARDSSDLDVFTGISGREKKLSPLQV